MYGFEACDEDSNILKLIFRSPKQFHGGTQIRLRSEMETLKFLEIIGIPVPKVYEYDATTENLINRPYAIQSNISGFPYFVMLRFQEKV